MIFFVSLCRPCWISKTLNYRNFKLVIAGDVSIGVYISFWDSADLFLFLMFFGFGFGFYSPDSILFMAFKREGGVMLCRLRAIVGRHHLFVGYCGQTRCCSNLFILVCLKICSSRNDGANRNIWWRSSGEKSPMADRLDTCVLEISFAYEMGERTTGWSDSASCWEKKTKILMRLSMK